MRPNKITGANAGRATSVANSDALDRPRRSVLTLGTEGSEVLILSVQSESSWLIGLFEFESGRGLEIGYDRRSRAIRKYPVHMRQLEVGVRLV